MPWLATARAQVLHCRRWHGRPEVRDASQWRDRRLQQIVVNDKLYHGPTIHASISHWPPSQHAVSNWPQQHDATVGSAAWHVPQRADPDSMSQLASDSCTINRVIGSDCAPPSATPTNAKRVSAYATTRARRGVPVSVFEVQKLKPC